MRPMNSAEPARIERLERQVAYLLRHLGIDPDVAASPASGSVFGSAADLFGAPPAPPQPFAAEPQPFPAEPQPFPAEPQPFPAEPQPFAAAAQPAGAQPLPATPAYPADLVSAVERGDQIAAIKAYRQWTGVGLREAKAAVEAMVRGGR
jgi:hypothetical protein